MRPYRFAAIKKLMLTAFSLLALIFCTQAALAQPGQGQGQGQRMNPEARISELISVLEITPEQEPAFREAMGRIAQEQRENMRERNQAERMERQAQREEMQARRAEMQAQRAEMQAMSESILATVLSTEQLTKFREMQERQAREMQSRMRDRAQQQPPVRHGN